MLLWSPKAPGSGPLYFLSGFGLKRCWVLKKLGWSHSEARARLRHRPNPQARAREKDAHGALHGGPPAASNRVQPRAEHRVRGFICFII